jgi:threonylcarbamoyladenosine tRNA methylthiotransferase MtaB
LGCKLNQLESESFADAFAQAGFYLQGVGGGAAPSIVIINTCTVTSKADQKARRVIRKALRDYPDSCVLVTGCYAQLDYAQIDKLDEDRTGRLFVLKGMEKQRLLDLPEFFTEGADALQTVKTWYESTQSGGEIARDRAFQFSPERFFGHTRSFLKIQDGCDKRCTYCRIRLARGGSISLGADTVLERLRLLEARHAEAVITGVNICQYKFEKEIHTEARRHGEHGEGIGDLGKLLSYLLAGTQKIALRLSSLEPDFIDEGFAKILSHKRIRPHFHLSVQSCSERVLQRMGRGYNGEIIERAVSLLRGAKDDPFLACDIITGFPGETEAEFEETYELCKKIGFAWIHVFPYSKRPGTVAFAFKDAVKDSEITKRVQILTDLAFLGRKAYVSRWLGREVEALVEGNGDWGVGSRESVCRGISENYLKLRILYEGERPPAGTVLRCRITAESSANDGEIDAVAKII